MDTEQQVLIIAAHPDDETIGAGVWMARRGGSLVTIVHVTGGSPRNPADAHAAGFESREEYARVRLQELHAAVALAGVMPDQCLCLDFIDQEAYLHLPELTERVAELVDRIRPGIVLTHPYEGGHPDHDAAAFAVAQAAKLCERRGLRHYEFTSYHASPDGMVTGEFLGPAPGLTVVRLTAAERELKGAMLGCFASQERVLRLFAVDQEKFRIAPRYDFTQAPHEGALQYEKFGWGITGEQWRQRAAAALESSTQRNFV